MNFIQNFKSLQARCWGLSRNRIVYLRKDRLDECIIKIYLNINIRIMHAPNPHAGSVTLQ